MDAIQILVEGSGDVLFLKQLLSCMEPALKSKWAKCTEPKQDPTVDESVYQIPTLTYRVEHDGRMLVVRAMNGVNNIFPMMEAFLTSFGYSVNVDDLQIVKNVFIVDADNSIKGNGTGGIASAKKKFRVEINKCKRLGVKCAGFAMPDNTTDGTLEDVLTGMIPVANRPVIDCCWQGFINCAKARGAPFEPTVKSMIDVYAKMFNRDAHCGIFASNSYKDPTTWNWGSPVLDNLKNFLRSEVLS